MNAKKLPKPESAPRARLDPGDHRELGRRLDLFHLRPEAPGMVFWHPAGLGLHRRLEAAARQLFEPQGYQEVRTPQVLREAVWQASGHWEHFRGAMMELAEQSVPAALKPVSCPGHLYVAAQGAPSYRDLPLRLAEFGVVHRDEPAGTLHGLFRLRQFTQDDGHLLCVDEASARAEVVRFCRDLLPFYAAFGFDQVEIVVATRPASRVGEDSQWDRAEAVLRAVLEDAGLAFITAPGDGAFYGPKIEFVLVDHAGRRWQCGTIQFDFHMPEAFDVAYVDADGQRRRPVMLHRAVFGSVERFMGMLLEQHRGRLPPWLAPQQVWVLPLSSAQRGVADDTVERLRRGGVRALVDHDGSLARRIRRAHEKLVSFVIVVGRRELDERRVEVRAANATVPVNFEALSPWLVDACAGPSFG